MPQHQGRRVLALTLLLALGAALAAAGSLGLLGVALTHGESLGLPLALCCAAALVANRVVAMLSDRQRSLQRLHELSQALADAPDSSDVVGLTLAQSVELLGARYAEVALLGGDEASPGCWLLRAGQPPVGPRAPVRPGIDTLPAPPTGHLVVRRRGAAERAFLDARELSEAIVVPLRGVDGVDGHLVVGDRTAPARAGADTDGRLLETVANHASVALRNGLLIHRLHVEARQDELTGLPNRLQLRERLDRIAAGAASGGPPCAVMVLDFDGFKAINDTLGHLAGDELLRVLAGRLAVVAAEDATVARLGGDEFAVLSTRCADAVAAGQLADRLLRVFDDPVTLAGARLRLGGSLGIALGPEHGGTGSDLLRTADIAMYAAKRTGGGRRLFSADLVQLTPSGLTLASDLRDAVEQGAIAVVVQPLVDMATERLHSVEVLARWRHPELGEVPPEQFFAAADRAGLVQALSAYVLDRGLGLARQWQDVAGGIRVAVNLASRWLADPTLPEQVGAALARHGVPAESLCLEITERGVIADPRHAHTTLTRLRAMGVHLALDDFGTGYSSLTYLSRLPVDQLKIDKSFISTLEDSGRDQAIVRSMIDLGRNLGLEVVAEGVMAPGVRDLLRELGCRLAQGYLFARPLHPAELLGYLGYAPATGPLPGHPPSGYLPAAHPLAGHSLFGGRPLGQHATRHPGQYIGQPPDQPVGQLSDPGPGRPADRRAGHPGVPSPRPGGPTAPAQ